MHDRARRYLVAGRNSSAPAEPDARMPPERGANRDLKAAGAGGRFRKADAVRDYDDARQ